MTFAAQRVIRCSSLPMLLKCGHSQDAAELAIEAAIEAADIGTAVHDAMRSVVFDSTLDIPLIALRHGVDEKDLAPLVWYGRSAWQELRASFPEPEVEVDVDAECDGFELRGHVDLLSISGEHVRFLDWKSGRKEEADYYPQLAAYAACLFTLQRCTTVTATVVWLRSQTVETYTFTESTVRAFMDRVYAALSPDAPFRYGEHCGYCRRSHECPALVANARRDLAIFSRTDVDTAVAQATPQELVSIRRRAKALVAFEKSLDQAIRRRVAEGPLDSGDGYMLSLVEENGQREVNTLKAWPILQKHLTDEELAGCVEVSAKAVDDVVGKKAGKGKGAAAKRALAEEFKAAEAITQPRIMKLKEVRVPQQLEKEGAE